MSKLEFSQTDQQTVIRHKGMDLLARREHSRLELARKLLQRFPDESSLIDEVLDGLQADNLQSDLRFAESFLRARVSRGQGPQRIIVELQQRGVSTSNIDVVLQECDVDWYAQAAAVFSRKYPGKIQGFSERAKCRRFLQYRGFDMEQINTVMKGDIN